MRLIVGLGNPGKKYKDNRHNVGYVVIDELKNQWTKQPKHIILTKTNVFMNSSGNAVKELIDRYSLAISHLCVVHDDLDLHLGTWKIQYAKGPKDHGGINDIEQKLGTKDFWRVRVGVDNRNLESRVLGDEYVLQDFTKDENEILHETIHGLIIDLGKKLKIRD